MAHLTICSCQVKNALQREFTLYICLNVEELLARSRRKIWSLSDCNRTRTHNHLVNKQTLNHLASLAKWLNVYELSGYEFESSCSHLNFKFCAYFEQEVPSHPGNYRVWIHSETLYVIWQEYTVIFAVLDCFKYFILYELFPFRKHK